MNTQAGAVTLLPATGQKLAGTPSKLPSQILGGSLAASDSMSCL